MAQYDVYRAEGVAGLLIDCQSDFLRHLATRFVIPLLPVGEVPEPMPRLHPSFRIDGIEFVLATHLATAVSVRELRDPVTSLDDARDTINAALDMLVLGF